jgi:hypothetical protein
MFLRFQFWLIFNTKQETTEEIATYMTISVRRLQHKFYVIVYEHTRIYTYTVELLSSDVKYILLIMPVKLLSAGTDFRLNVRGLASVAVKFRIVVN